MPTAPVRQPADPRLIPHLPRVRTGLRLGTVPQMVVLTFGAIGLRLLPWTAWLSTSLKPHHSTDNWDLAWSGFDIVLASLFMLTAMPRGTAVLLPASAAATAPYNRGCVVRRDARE